MARTSGIELPEEDIPFLNRFYVVQRFGWGMAITLVAAALLGLFGGSEFSRSREQSGPLQLEYDRFGRKDSPYRVRVVVHDTASFRPVELTVNLDYLSAFTLEQITPEPERVMISNRAAVYTFSQDAGSSETPIIFHLEPNQSGVQHGTISYGDNRLSITNFIYP